MSILDQRTHERLASLNGANCVPNSFCSNVRLGGAVYIIKVSDPSPFPINCYGYAILQRLKVGCQHE